MLAAVLAAAGPAAAGCGGERQDASEPRGEFELRVGQASFPASQAIAEPARLRIEVVNADTRTIPDVAVTVETKPGRGGAAPLAFGAANADTRLADSGKPVWIVDQGPGGGETALTNTWALGPLRAGDSRTFEWKLTAVKPGTYTIAYRVAPGLYGRARPAGGERIGGSFRVTISDKPVPARVDDDGNVVRGEPAGTTPRQ
jgi:hypothetical protein